MGKNARRLLDVCVPVRGLNRNTGRAESRARQIMNRQRELQSNERSCWCIALQSDS